MFLLSFAVFPSRVSAFVLRWLTRDEDHEDYRMGGVGGS